VIRVGARRETLEAGSGRRLGSVCDRRGEELDSRKESSFSPGPTESVMSSA